MDPNNTISANKWYLVLGSGPIDGSGAGFTAMTEVTSSQQAKIYIIDLNAVGAGSTPLLDAKGNSLPTAGAFQTLPDSNSFISDLIAVDFDLNYKTNAVYFGTISGSSPNYGGKLRRIVLNDDLDPNSWDADSTLIDVGLPISAAPTVAVDDDGRFWVYVGTGRFFTRDDILYTATQSYFGVIEPWTDSDSDGKVKVSELNWSTALSANLVDVTNAVVYEDGNDVTGVAVPDSNSSGNIDFDELVAGITAQSGWRLNFPDPGERNLGQAALLGHIAAFKTYTPSSDPCTYEGSSKLYPLYYKTGTAYYRSVVGLGSSILHGKNALIQVVDLGDGMTTTPNIHVDTPGGQGKSKAFIQTSTGAILTIEQTNPGVTKSGKFHWQEFDYCN